ncbi:hypothetical protein AGMMS49525_11460 [Bacteroidia bacterium]|nr:hypothetical protein AGMMS49525_11460 [Bacteroidia bacterium]
MKYKKRKRHSKKWIAIVENNDGKKIVFIAIDHCKEYDFIRPDGMPDKRCDGVLTFNASAIFVELKERTGNQWAQDAERQLRSTISHFNGTKDAEKIIDKRAYIANSRHPKFTRGQQERMDKFLNDTGYILRIENRIEV